MTNTSIEQALEVAISFIIAERESLTPRQSERLAGFVQAAPAVRRAPRVPTPVREFLHDRYAVSFGSETPLLDVWSAWNSWAGGRGVNPDIVAYRWLTRWIRKVYPNVTTIAVKQGDVRTKYLVGITPLSD